VIAYCWEQGKDVRCVLISPGPEPLPRYYAYPGSSHDWKNTASSLRTSSPDLYGKYSPRQPDSEERSSDEYKKYGESWYRRFYRDFNTGFKNVGSQGGEHMIHTSDQVTRKAYYPRMLLDEAYKWSMHTDNKIDGRYA